MSFIKLNPVPYLFFFLKKESDKFFLSVAIRGFALGMITIFVPIYLYQYFNSIALTLVFYAVIFALYGILVPIGGLIMMNIGIKKAMLASHPFFLSFFVCLLFFDASKTFIPLAALLYSVGMIFFWPAYHVNFSRVSESARMGKEVGKLNFITALPGILAPAVGGTILSLFGYPTLFVAVLCALASSAIPLLLSEDARQTYSDSYLKAYKRIFKKENRYHNLAFAAVGMEAVINGYLWPLFLMVVSIGYLAIGSIATIALIVSLLFTLYMGRITDRVDKRKLLTIGSILTSGAWIGKFFVTSPVSAFLAQSFYRFSRTAAGIPFQAILYKKAEARGHEIDEFIIYKGIVVGITKSVFLLILAALSLAIPDINFFFMFAAAISLGFVFIGRLSKSL